MKLNYEVYFADQCWWFRLVEVSAFGAPVATIYRRRYRSSEEASRCGAQALAHEIAKRREYREKLVMANET